MAINEKIDKGTACGDNGQEETQVVRMEERKRAPKKKIRIPHPIYHKLGDSDGAAEWPDITGKAKRETLVAECSVARKRKFFGSCIEMKKLPHEDVTCFVMER